jgi:hypothetical protein
MVKMGFDLNARTREEIANYEQSEEWKQYYGKDPISNILTKGEEDEREIRLHEERQAVL